MYNRYGDIEKFITDADKLQITDDATVYISGPADYDIAVDLEDCYDTFENVKPFIATVAKHICEMDNTVLRFNNTTRRNDKLLKYAKLPSPVGFLRYDYAKSMEKAPAPIEKDFPFILTFLFIEEPNFVTLDYWALHKNNQLPVTFEYKDGRFFLRTYGAFDCIPDDWDKD